jgi:hypothetical protein
MNKLLIKYTGDIEVIRRAHPRPEASETTEETEPLQAEAA